jgi:hypothetical protein
MDGDDGVGEVEERVDHLLPAFVAALQPVERVIAAWKSSRTRPPRATFTAMTTAPGRAPVTVVAGVLDDLAASPIPPVDFVQPAT